MRIYFLIFLQKNEFLNFILLYSSIFIPEYSFPKRPVRKNVESLGGSIANEKRKRVKSPFSSFWNNILISFQ
jgi:hypothetical protein